MYYFLPYRSCPYFLLILFAGQAAVTADVRGDASELPNIVYILADDLGIGDVSCYNRAAAWRTTHIDQVAADGLRFNDAHSGSSVCTPTRYGILTGRYAWRTRLCARCLGRNIASSDRPAKVDRRGLSAATRISHRLFWQVAFGLGLVHKDQRPTEIDFSQPVRYGPSTCGFDTYFCHSGSLDMPPYVYVQDDHVTAEPDRTTVNTDFQGFWREGPTGADFHHELVLPKMTELAVNYIRDRADVGGPFFLYLALPAPHTPILPTDAFQGQSGTNAYGDFVLQVDDVVGQILQALDTTGLAKQTLLIVTSDNGCSPRARFDELAQWGHDPSYIYRGHKADIFEGGHRIPFVVRWPDRVKAGRVSDQTLCLTDLMRTCAALVQRPLPDDAAEDSVSFLDVLDAKLDPKTPFAPAQSIIRSTVRSRFVPVAGS